MATLITEPGVYDLTAEEYHADPVEGGSLSSTGARKLLSATPATFRYEQTNPPPFKAEFNFGHAAHSMVLGKGAEVVVLDFDSYRTKAAREAKEAALAAGQVPLLPDDHAKAEAMAAAVLRHPVAHALLTGPGEAEKAFVWHDQIWRRSLVDWIRPPAGNARAVMVDYKTCDSADLEAIGKATLNHGYHQQQEWYRDGYRSLYPNDPDPAFVFVFQEKHPPYLVQVVELDVVASQIGRRLNADAVNLYQWCELNDQWPGYSDEVQLVSLPAWAENRYASESVL